MAETIYAQGLYFNKKFDRAPAYVLGSISINPKKFIDWVNTQTPDSYGYVKLQVKEGKDGKPYVCLDTYKKQPSPSQKPETIEYPDTGEDGELPF